jgi:DNA-binding transcriptional LysR family regulator
MHVADICMHKMNIETLDLNLLLVLQALLQEQSVTRAGAKIGLSQSATSHALGRLRDFFQDPLLIRTPKGMMLTPRAEELTLPLADILLKLDRMIQPALFDPATAQRKIRIAATDYATAVILPVVLKELTQVAPQVEVECHYWNSDVVEMCRKGRIDLGFGIVDIAEIEDVRSQTLFMEDFVSVVRANHPLVQHPGTGIAQTDVTLDSYIAWPHALITISNSLSSPVDRALGELGLQRRIMLRIPQFLAAPFIVAQTDFILTIPRRIALLIASTANLQVLELPIPLNRFGYPQVWHERHQADPFHSWFRQLVISQTSQL